MWVGESLWLVWDTGGRRWSRRPGLAPGLRDLWDTLSPPRSTWGAAWWAPLWSSTSHSRREAELYAASLLRNRNGVTSTMSVVGGMALLPPCRQGWACLSSSPASVFSCPGTGCTVFCWAWVFTGPDLDCLVAFFHLSDGFTPGSWQAQVSPAAGGKAKRLCPIKAHSLPSSKLQSQSRCAFLHSVSLIFCLKLMLHQERADRWR